MGQAGRERQRHADGVSTEERDRIKALEREVRELRQANEILRKGEAIFRHWSEDNGRAHILPPLSHMQACVAVQRDRTRPPTQAMIGVIDDRRAVYGVDPTLCGPSSSSLPSSVIAELSQLGLECAPGFVLNPNQSLSLRGVSVGD